MKKLLVFSFILSFNNIFSQTTWSWVNHDLNNSYNDANNWDDGLGGVGIPTAGDDIFFDPAFSTDNCTIDASIVDITTINIVQGYTGSITLNNGTTISISGDFNVSDGIFTGGNGSSTINIGGSYNQTGGSFTKPPAAMTVSGNFNLSGGDFHETISFTNITGNCNISGSGSYYGTSGAFTVANVSICFGSSTNLSATGANSYTWSPSASLNTKTGSLVIATPTITTTYTVTGTYVNRCKNSSTPTVIVNSLPTTSISGGLTTCEGIPTALTANGGNTYLWSTNATTQTISVSTSGTFTVTATNVSGCTKSVSASVTANPLPTASILGSLSTCEGTPTTLTANGGNTYLWSTNATTQTISISTSGTFTVTAINVSGCTKSVSASVTANPLPTASISGSLTTCEGTPTILTANGGTSYLWSNGSIDQTLSVSIAGTLTVTVTNINGCVNSVSASVIVNSLPIASISGNLTTCEGTPTTLTANGGNTYLWSTDATTQIISVSTSGTFTVTAINVSGCVNSVSAVVTINPLSTVSISGSLTTCEGIPTALTANGGTSYLWSNGSTDQTLSVSIAGTLTVTVTNINGCVNSVSASLTVNPLPTVSISGNLTTCEGTPITLTANGGNTYLWSTNATTQTISVSTSGTFTVTVINVSGCVNSVSVVITVHSLPVIMVTGNTNICQGSSTLLTANGALNYRWNPLTGIDNPNSGNVTADPTATITYTVTGNANNGCSGETTVSIVVDICTGIEEISLINSFNLYPNPTNEKVTLEIDLDQVTNILIRIIDIKGQEVYHETKNQYQGQYTSLIDLSEKAKGIYTLQVITDTETIAKKIILN